MGFLFERMQIPEGEVTCSRPRLVSSSLYMLWSHPLQRSHCSEAGCRACIIAGAVKGPSSQINISVGNSHAAFPRPALSPYWGQVGISHNVAESETRGGNRLESERWMQIGFEWLKKRSLKENFVGFRPRRLWGHVLLGDLLERV